MALKHILNLRHNLSVNSLVVSPYHISNSKQTKIEPFKFRISYDPKQFVKCKCWRSDEDALDQIRF